MPIVEDVDICHYLDEESREEEETLFRNFSSINEHLKDEFSKYSIRDLYEL